MRIEIAGLKKKYGEAVAVRSLDLTVNEGEFLVLLGPSGCGKTTTLRSVAGLEEPTAGEIRIGDKTVYSHRKRVSVPPEGRDIGMVFQSYALWPHMTVYENVAFPLQSKKKGKGATIRPRVMETLGLVGLDALASRSASLLSGGQMQRVALARALVSEPAALLLDEPLSNLDLRLRHTLRAELKRIQQGLGATSLYVTHDQTEAASLADRVVVMQEGEIAQESTPEELFARPQSRFVANFLGIPNIFSFTPVSVEADGSITGLLEESVEVRLVTSVALRIGETVDCWFRDDALQVTEQGSGNGVIKGEVLVREFTGVNYRYHLSVGGRADALKVSVELPLEHDYNPGDLIPLRFRDNQVHFITCTV